MGSGPPPPRLVTAAALTLIAVSTVPMLADTLGKSDYVGDDIYGFYLARTKPFLEFLRTPIDVQPNRLRQIALCNAGDRAGHFGRRSQQIVDQRVDRHFHLSP